MSVSPNRSTVATGLTVSAIIPPEGGDIDLGRRPLPALLMSLIFHVVLLTILGILWSKSSSGTGDEVNRSVGIAMVHRLPDRDRYVDAADLTESQHANDASAAVSSDSAATSAAAAAPANLAPPIDLTGILSEIHSTPTPISAAGLAGESKLDGDSFAARPASGTDGDPNRTTTSVFGVSGSGSRFVYVFDRSDSMNANGALPLRAAKKELMISLKTLSERQQFQLIFYNQMPKPFQISGMPQGLMLGEEAILERAARYVDSITAYGGTEHFSAISMALRLGPDVIFFLTDARIPRLSTSQLAEIRRRAERSGTTIHAIEFGSEPVAPSDSFLRDLASQNSGLYNYVDIRSLKLSP
ncbi:hypothetical protein Q31b_05690 [Novipirellula aureliae]|uniref:VWFA domain-containing protein n=1 Tax=Novipirellula aureliae TaxID=2527966 RepID=A0A5C6EBS9_9BACT|nr:hypothetical protein [Novipirellula aureliae]TWU45397.1 hypothetical protein Q31b_05690 [Novipirellula aureliae]